MRTDHKHIIAKVSSITLHVSPNCVILYLNFAFTMADALSPVLYCVLVLDSLSSENPAACKCISHVFDVTVVKAIRSFPQSLS